MKRQFILFSLSMLLILGAVFPESRASSPRFKGNRSIGSGADLAETEAPGPEGDRLHPAVMDPPESCGVPFGGPFGKDVEILLNDMHYELEPNWYPRAGIPCSACPGGFSKPASNIAATPLDTEKVAAVWRESSAVGHEGELRYNIWDASGDRTAWELVTHGPGWSDTEGWNNPQYYSTIQTADIDGDGTAELLARNASGMETWRFDGSAWQYVTFGPGWNDAGGWGAHKHYSTIQTADIDGDGAAELLARNASGMETWRFDGSAWQYVTSGPGWNDAGGWGAPQYYSTIQTADIDGDGAAELLARNASGMETWRFDGSAWQYVTFGPGWNDAGGWGAPQYYSTIQTADIDGDGAAELLARNASGMETWRFDGSAWQYVTFGPGWSDAGGWGAPQYYSTIQTADIDGDGAAELLARNASGMETWRFDGSAWQYVTFGPGWSDAGGWNNPQYYSTIQTADIDGDGTAELLARSASGMETWRFDTASVTWGLVVSNNPGWANAYGWGQPEFYSTIQTADVDGDGTAELLARDAGGMETWRFSDAPGAWGAEQDWLGLTPEGSPAVLSKWGLGWEIYARDDTGQIQYTTWLSPTTFTDWRPVPGTKYVTSDPVVVSRRHGHTALFYRDHSGKVWFTEREGSASVWRDTPLDLTPDISPVFSVFLPLVVKGGSGSRVVGMTAASPARPLAPVLATASPSAFASELSAISRNENHLAVFGIDTTGQLWVKDWTTLNASDWRDTSWVKLSEGVKNEKPAVASRHSNHLAVAFRDESGVAHVIEWAAQTGWGTPDALGVAFAGPLTLVAADSGAMSLFGPHAGGLVQTVTWTQDGGWDQPETGLMRVSSDHVMSAAVRRPGDVMLLATTGGMGLYSHFTSQGRDLTETERVLQPPQDEHYRNQVLAWVQGRIYYLAVLAVDKAAGATWDVEAYDLDGDVAQQGLTLGDHAYAVGSPVSVAAGDLDFDGSDEIIVATYDHPTARLSVLDLSVTEPDTVPTLSMVVAATVTETFSISPALDLSLAIGDLDGDVGRSEVVLAATLEDAAPGDDPLHAVAKLYQFVPGAPAELQEKSNGFLPIDNDSPFDGHWELEVATGRLLPNQPGEQLAVAISGEQNSTTSCDQIKGFVNTYGVVPSEPYWAFTPIHSDLAVAEGIPNECPGSPGNPYRSAVATGDLDADGYQEIAAWYLDRVFVIDPNDPDGPGDPVPGWWIEPKRPLDNAQYWQSPRSLAVDDLDRDGRAEIVAAAWLQNQNTGEYGFRFALLELLGDGELSPHEYGPAQPVRKEGTVLAGDLDGDGLVSELVGCNTSGEYSVVGVVNGLPRPYENGQPIFDSTGSYSVEEAGGSSESSGTTYNIGAGLTVGFEREINIPFVGKVASFKASVTQDFLYSSGISEEREVITAFGSNYEFDQGLGIVVYNLVDTTCYYYDVFRPDNPLETSRAMSCKPGSSDTLVMTLEQWHTQSTKDAASWSWVDVGHRAPGGALTNDLLEPGNYLPVLPVDEFLLLFEFDRERIAETGGAKETWYASQATGRARTEFEQFEANTTASVGASAGGVSVEASASFGMGRDNSHTMSWSDTIAFAGGYSWAGGGYPSYWAAPYVYQATAETLAGITYPYWVMDYYVTGLRD